MGAYVERAFFFIVLMANCVCSKLCKLRIIALPRLKSRFMSNFCLKSGKGTLLKLFQVHSFFMFFERFHFVDNEAAGDHMRSRWIRSG